MTDQKVNMEKELDFDLRFHKPNMSGCRQYTIRKGHRHFDKHIKILGQNAIVNGFKHYILSTVPLDILVLEGFKTVFDMLIKMQRHYPDMQLNTPVTVIEFRMEVESEGSTKRFRPNANLRYTL